MPNGAVKVEGRTETYEITGPFRFYGTSEELRAIGSQLIDKADALGAVGLGWADCDPSAVVPEKTIKKVA